MRSLTVFRTVRWFGCLILIMLAFIASLSTRAAGREQSKALQVSSQNAEGEYAGSDTCVVCHADQGQHFQNTVMGKAFVYLKTDKEKLGCEACHGLGKLHVDAS